MSRRDRLDLVLVVDYGIIAIILDIKGPSRLATVLGDLVMRIPHGALTYQPASGCWLVLGSADLSLGAWVSANFSAGEVFIGGRAWPDILADEQRLGDEEAAS